MLKGISPLFNPKLLAIRCRMGHSDEIALADAHFPGHSFNEWAIRPDGLQIEDLLDAALPLFALDTYVGDPTVMMAVTRKYTHMIFKKGVQEFAC